MWCSCCLLSLPCQHLSGWGQLSPVTMFGPSGRSGSRSHTPWLAWPLLLFLSSLFLANLPVEVGAAITDQGQLNAIAALTDQNNGPCIDNNTYIIAGDPCSGTGSSTRRIVCNAEKTQILQLYCYGLPASVSFTVPSEMSGLTYMTLL